MKLTRQEAIQIYCAALISFDSSEVRDVDLQCELAALVLRKSAKALDTVQSVFDEFLS